MTRTRATSGHGATTRLLIALACALVLLPLPAAHARLGDLDPLFDGDGMAFPNVGPSTAARFDAMTSRPDGRPIAAGWATSTGGIDEPVVMQLTNEGVPDNGFGVSGLTRVTSSGPATQLHAVALDAGSVLAAGNRRPSATSPPPGAPFVMRLTPTGGVDTSFADDLTNFTGELTGVLPVAEDKVLAGGWRRLTGPTAVDVFFLARLNDTGTLDQTFGNGGFVDLGFGPAAHAEAMAWGPGERIVLAGWALAQGVRRPALARFNADGSPDLSFGTRGTEVLTGIDGELRGISVDGVGRITAAGISGTRALVIRRLENGGPDPAFGTGGETYRDAAALNGLALDGSRSLVAGRGEPSQLLLGSLDGAGAPEAALGGSPPGWRTFPGPAEAFGVALGPGGTVYTAGGATTPFISRHLPNAAPTAALASPAQVLVGEAATFDAVGSSDPEGEQLRHAFDLDGNGTFEFDGGTNPLALRSFPAPGNFNVGVQVTDPRGGSATATRAIAVVAAPEPIPQPVLGKQGVAKPLSGIVRYRLPGTKKFVRLVEITAIPNGTEIDARKGRLLITVLHDASGQLDGARFYAGRFIFRQGKGATPITTLKLTGGSFKNCTVKGAKASSVLAVAASVKGGPGTRSKRRVRKLWGDGRGRFRTRGRYGAATVRGTKWLTLDRCDGTKVRVVRGKVSVQDLVRPNRKPKLVKAGGKAFVRYKRGG